MKSNKLPDVQATQDTRGKAIDQVGITDYRFPFTVRTKVGYDQQTIGTLKMTTNLNAQVKGVNMSRYSRLIEQEIKAGIFSLDFVKDLLSKVATTLEATDSRIVIDFPYFIKQLAPVSETLSHFVIDCNFCGELQDGQIDSYLEIKCNYTSLCPCSKEMCLSSDGCNGQGAHSQRSLATIRVKTRDNADICWIEDLVDIVKKVASCPIYNSLKREDEQFVTQAAYSNPKFVEDFVRDAAIELDKLDNIDGYIVTAENYESIHQSNAFARIRKNM